MRCRIIDVKAIVLTCPYGNDENMEVKWHLPHGYRTCGMIQISLENGLVGLGEAYIAVFAPHVFKSIVDLVIPYIKGRYIEDHELIMKELEIVCGYWSRQGAARHVLSSVDIALYDLLARMAGLPLCKYLNPDSSSRLKLYASGGDSESPQSMQHEFDLVERFEIDVFKIRARKHETDKANWCMEEGNKRGIQIAIDMTQNLVVPGQCVADVVRFVDSLNEVPYFLEEPLGPELSHCYPALRDLDLCKIAGGEIITLPSEIVDNLRNGYYDIAQPDATVIGGISALKLIFNQKRSSDIFVHCWGGPVGMAANYHAAAAFGGKMAEWPLPRFPLRDLLADNWSIQGGFLEMSEAQGLGITLNEEVVQSYAFKEDAVYSCLPHKSQKELLSWK